MTDAKKLKRKIRDRASRTGESYAAARRHVLAQVDDQRQKRSQQAASEARTAPATGAVSEARCIEKTGHGFDYWFAVLDRFGAPKKGHTAAATHLREDHDVSAWYSQSITVLYERARGIRVLNQASSGSHQVSVSRVLPAPFEAAQRCLTEADVRKRWLGAVDDVLAAPIDEAAEAGVKTKTDAAWIRIRLDREDSDRGRIELRISATKNGRSQAVARIEQLPDAEAVPPERARWRQAIDELKQVAVSLEGHALEDDAP